ncbi:MAG: hypothetical protein A2Y16_00400 [Tenericutes bacterium GWF2_57_13]|nr:MAG: hypothetical protein A2Y16_00400 [Tenericutes bacterium GWF2_57_13]
MPMILNIAFFGILGLGLLGGLAKGFKKSLFTLVTMAAFYALFFLTLDAVVGFLWTYENPAIGTALAQVDASLSGYTSLGEAMTPLIQFLIPDFDLSGANAELTALLLGIGQFILKIGYTIAYFTAGLIIWKIVMWIVKMIFIHNRPGASKHRLLGAVIGTANGALALFVMFIMLGGVVSIVDSVASLVPTTELASPLDRDEIYEASQSLIPLAEGDGGLEDSMAMVTDFVDAYQNNALVRFGDLISIGEGTEAAPLTLYLFDQVMSFTYDGQIVALRQELVVIGTVAGAIFDALEDAGIDISNMDNVDFALVIGAVGSVDLTMLMDSKLISTALIYVLSGEAGIEDLDTILIVPDGITWYDTLDDEGNITENGELRNLLLALNAIVDVAGAIDFNNIGFDVITALTDDTIDAIFESRILTATISDVISTQLAEAEDNPLVVPDSVFDTEGNILKTEMIALVHAIALVVETAGTDPENFDFAQVLQLEGTDVDTLLDSQILAATVGKMIADIVGEDLIVPSTVLDSTTFEVDGIAITVVTAEEIKAVFASLAVLGITDFENMAFDATILSHLEGEDPGELDNAKIETLFGSDILHATISNMIIDATAEAGSVLTVPYFDASGVAIRETLGDTVVISIDELGNVLKAIYALDIEDFANFNTLDASTIVEKMPLLLESAILHATISAQILSMAGGVITVPYVDETGINDIRVTVGVGIEETEYISMAELTAVIGALDALDLADPTDFSGTVSLSFFSDAEVRAALLESAIMQATISDQLLSLGGGVLTVPTNDVSGNAVIVTVGDVGFQTSYVMKWELDAMFIALGVLGISDIDAITGEFTLASLSDEADQDALLASASMHATISKTLLDLSDDVLIVPEYDADGLGSSNRVKIVQGATVYVRKIEIKALVNAFLTMGFADLSGFGAGIDSALFIDNAAVILESASMHATISDQLINTAGAALLIPDLDVENANDPLRVTVLSDGVEYVVKTEILNLLASLDLLGLTDFGTLSFAIGTLFTGDLDFDVLLASASLQATISDSLLPTSDTELTMVAGGTDLVVPTEFRQAITVDGAAKTQISGPELAALLDAMKILGVGAYGEAMSGDTITDLSGTDIDTMLLSGSIHVSLYNMLSGNAAITTPDLAKEVNMYGVLGLTKADELRNFIVAVNAFGGSDFSAAAFDVNGLLLLPPGDRTTVLTSMIVRDSITDDIEALDGPDPFFTLVATDYMENNVALFLTAAGVQRYLSYLDSL